jgi:hypothetical protein
VLVRHWLDVSSSGYHPGISPPVTKVSPARMDTKILIKTGCRGTAQEERSGRFIVTE